MSFIAYLKSFLPQFSKDRVSELARINQSEIDTLVIPSYKEAEMGLRGRNFKSKSIQDFSNVFKQNVGMSNGDNIVTAILKAMERVSANNKYVSEKTDNTFESEIVIAGVSVLKVNLIRLLELNSFVSRYAMRFLNYIYILETEATNADPRYTKDSLSMGEIAWLEKNFLDFCFALRAVSKSEKEVTKLIDNIPDVVLGDSAEMMIQTIGEAKTDPFNTKIIAGFTSSPIFHVRLIVAQYQANRYKEQKELKAILELRLLNLKNSQQGKPDASVEKQIVYIQSRVDRLSEELRKAEGE